MDAKPALSTTELITQKIDAIMNFVEKSATNATDFVAEQTPLFIKELLAWHFTSSLIICIIASLICGVSVYWVRYHFKNVKEVNDKHGSGEAGTRIVFLSILSAISLCVAFAHYDWLKISVAPRVWLVEYVRDIVKQTK